MRCVAFLRNVNQGQRGHPSTADIIAGFADAGCPDVELFQSNGTVRNNQTGLCLDVNNNQTANGTLVLLWTCTGAANQQWSRR